MSLDQYEQNSQKWFRENRPFFIFPWHAINKALKIQCALCQDCPFIAYTIEEYEKHQIGTGHHLEKV